MTKCLLVFTLYSVSTCPATESATFPTLDFMALLDCVLCKPISLYCPSLIWILLVSYVSTLYPFLTDAFQAVVLKNFLSRRKAAVVLRKVAEGLCSDCGQYGFFAVFAAAVYLPFPALLCGCWTAESCGLNSTCRRGVLAKKIGWEDYFCDIYCVEGFSLERLRIEELFDYNSFILHILST